MKSAVCLQTKFWVLYDINWCHDHSMTKNVFIPILYCSMWKLSEKSLNMIEKYLVFTILNKLHILSMPNHCNIFYYHYLHFLRSNDFFKIHGLSLQSVNT